MINYENAALPFNLLYMPASGNRKTGSIPQTYTGHESCPIDCAMRAACYADHGHTAPVVKRCANENDPRAVRTYSELRALVSTAIREGADILRHGVAGDFAIRGGNQIDKNYLLGLAWAYQKIGFGYTHCVQCVRTDKALLAARSAGFNINYSCERIVDAEKAALRGFPAVLTVPRDSDIPRFTKKGIRLVQCPNQTRGISCAKCRLCARQDRKVIIVFKAHGPVRIAARCIEVAQHEKRKIIPIRAI